MEEKFGIYEITCATCKRKYRGQSKRRVHKRWKEHESACRLKYFEETGVAKHCPRRYKIGKIKLFREVKYWPDLTLGGRVISKKKKICWAWNNQ
jgi:hypothetical protein